jgi:hypothetical protein
VKNRLKNIQIDLEYISLEVIAENKSRDNGTWTSTVWVMSENDRLIREALQRRNGKKFRETLKENLKE